MPASLAAICALMSAMLVSGLRAGCGASPSSARNAASRKWPPSRMRKSSITTPSSSRRAELGGVEPGVVPPMSAWWPRLPTKKRISLPASSNTGATTVTSGRWVPPLNGSLRTIMSPGLSVAPRRAMTVRTLSPIAPRCTGTCGALTIRRPSASNSAQEKSSRSLMLTLVEVLRSTVPICSATAMNMLLNSSSRTGSGASPAASWCVVRGVVRVRISCPPAFISAVQPGSTTVVAVASLMIAGPGTRSPASIASRS